MHKLIGLTGLARSGKDTFADFIIKRSPELLNGTQFKRIAFASPIKEFANNLFIWNEEHSNGSKKETVLTTCIYCWKTTVVRAARQSLGKYIDNLTDGEVVDLFKEKVLNHIQVLNNDIDSLTLDVKVSPREIYQLIGTEFGRNIHPNLWIDLALSKVSNENTVITDVRFDNEAKAIRNKGGSIIKIERKGIKSVNSHVSESGISNLLIDKTIQNNSTLEDLEKESEKVILYV